MLTYKNYVAHVEFNDEIDIFYGEVINNERTAKEVSKEIFCQPMH